ncbi:MAG: hypothetical protein Q7T55_10260 [Solirubrobacteraceae bacterium]|nr:hypothetical protein [Solirubrobacteraceae bacterium]
MALFSHAAVASAQESTPELPLCPAADEALLTFPPDYARRGQSYKFSVERKNDSVPEFLVQSTLPTNAADAPLIQQEAFQFDDSGETEAIRPVPAHGRNLGLRFSWTQNADTPSACRGNDNYPEIPIVAADAKVGKPDLTRIAGRYRVHRRYEKDRPTWSLRPDCDIFGCTTTVRSSGGLRGLFRIDDEHGYVFEQRSRIGRCEVTTNGRTVKWSIFSIRTIKVRPTSVVRGVATALTGSERYSEEIPSDEFGVCTDPTEFVQRITLRRLGSPPTGR